MAFEIIWDTDARKFLRKLDSKIASRIVKKVDFIRDNPQDYLEPVKQTNSYKLRVGDYRAIIDIDWKNEILPLCRTYSGNRAFCSIWSEKRNFL